MEIWFVIMSASGFVLAEFCPFADFRPSVAPGAVDLYPIHANIRDTLCSVHDVVNAGKVVWGRSHSTLSTVRACTSDKDSPMAQALEALASLEATVVHRSLVAGLITTG